MWIGVRIRVSFSIIVRIRVRVSFGIMVRIRVRVSMRFPSANTNIKKYE